MRAVVQRVKSASVSIAGYNISEIDCGFLIFLGVDKNDVQKDLDYVVNKTINLRIFKDEQYNMNLSIKEFGGEALVVSQFTLCANTSRGRRPSFINAADPKIAELIYNQFCTKLEEGGIHVQTGRFGAMMEVSLINDGPVTIFLDSRDRG
jgi:D-tyrosyl-tRNA(Tyr) deacylase